MTLWAIMPCNTESRLSVENHHPPQKFYLSGDQSRLCRKPPPPFIAPGSRNLFSVDRQRGPGGVRESPHDALQRFHLHSEEARRRNRGSLSRRHSTPIPGSKYCVVVDHDVDVFDAGDVWWAVGTRSCPERGTVLIEDTPGFYRDPYRLISRNWGSMPPPRWANGTSLNGHGYPEPRKKG